MPGGCQVWIYKFEGDELVAAFSSGATPTEFNGDVKAHVVVLRFKKRTRSRSPVRSTQAPAIGAVAEPGTAPNR